MYWPLTKTFYIGCLFALCISNGVFAASTDATWSAWFSAQINQHPDIVAAREQMNAALSMAEASEQPLYNPELETEFEHEGSDDNYRIGVSQTIDWWGKRGVRKSQARFSRTAARQAFEFTLQTKTAEALQAIIEWQAADQQLDLARGQETRLDTLVALVKNREQAGDLGQVDVEMVFLGLSQTFNATVKAQVQSRQAEAHLRELLLDWSPKLAQISDQFWHANKIAPVEQWLNEHPAVLAARARWQVVQQSAELARRATKADPTFGINVGETGEDDVVSLTFSMPLNVRNNFSAEARAASQQAISAQAEYQALRRKQQFAIEASQAVFREYQQRFKHWQSLMQGRGERIGQLLEKQWRSGDLSTTEYLLASQQRADGLAAGIELRTQFRLTHIDWLLQSGQINTVLVALK